MPDQNVSFADAALASPAATKTAVPLPFQRKDWLALAAIVLVAIDLRPGIVSVGPLLPAIRDDFALSHAAASLLTTIPDLLMGLLALPTPWLARRFGRDPVLLVALILLCLAVATRAFAPTTGLLLVTTVGVGAGIAVVGALMAGFVKASFPTRAAVVMGIYATALSFGSTISAAVTGPISVHGGWRLASGMWSALGIVAVLAWLAITIEDRRARAVTRIAVPRVPLPLRSKTAWLVALFFAADNFLFYSILTWTAPMYREHGFSATTAGLILASFTFAFMCSNPVFGWLSTSHDRRPLLALCAVLTAAGLIPLAIAPDFAPFVWIPLAAFGLGGGFTLGMTLPLDNTHSVEEANVWNAFVLTVGYLIAATGPLLAGALRDVTGGFQTPVWIMAAVAIGMLALTPLLKPQTATP